ncbi:MAG: hypothetical protein M3680_25480, partial [Myxococcota bacterium]|nr:hypothetical protein [Myxococcota bacterium]
MVRRFRVQPARGAMLGGAAFFGACAAVLAWASTRTTGVIVNGLLELSASTARLLYLGLAAASLGFVAIALFSILPARARELVLEDDAVIMPGPLWKRRASPCHVPFADVVSLREQAVGGQRFLTLVTATAKHSVARSHLPDGAYEELERSLREGVARAAARDLR